MIKKSLFTILLITTASSVEAGFSIGISHDEQNIQLNDVRNFKLIKLTAGYKFTEYLQVEYKLAKGYEGYTKYISTDLTYNADLTSQNSLSIKLITPNYNGFSLSTSIGESKSIYHVSGYAPLTDVDGVVIGTDKINLKNKPSGLTYSVGGLYGVNTNLNILVEYHIYPSFEPAPNITYDWSGVNVGLEYSF
jgi:hypothetical protein